MGREGDTLALVFRQNMCSLPRNGDRDTKTIVLRHVPDSRGPETNRQTDGRHPQGSLSTLSIEASNWPAEATWCLKSNDILTTVATNDRRTLAL